ncbi:MAG: Mrp/NBP35 family ATP-binding protein [Armatimonadota bacterium]|nr:MAG: Mrp/NBP35 family ATP-binding protein [Armatimonadota bacterium]
MKEGESDTVDSCDHECAAASPGAREAAADATPSLAQQMSRIQRVVGVMSGKGGVGKSLVTALLAGAARQAGYAVGVMDADVTGSSIPKMVGLTGRPDASETGLSPVISASGIRVISLNLLLEHPDDPVIWRGPLLAGAVKQFWEEVVWGELDWLFVDLPPGTSDVPLTVMQSLPLDGVIIVSSPQELAAMIVRKAIKMAAHLRVRVLGLVENMTHLDCPHCGKRVDLFGPPGGPNAARAAGIPVLTSLRVDPELSVLSDRGEIEAYARNPFAGHIAALESILHGAPAGQRGKP